MNLLNFQTPYEIFQVFDDLKFFFSKFLKSKRNLKEKSNLFRKINEFIEYGNRKF